MDNNLNLEISGLAKDQKETLFDLLHSEFEFLEKDVTQDNIFEYRKHLMIHLFDEQTGNVCFTRHLSALKDSNNTRKKDHIVKYLEKFMDLNNSKNNYVITLLNENETASLNHEFENEDQSYIMNVHFFPASFLNKLIELAPYIYLNFLYSYKTIKNLKTDRLLMKSKDNIQKLIDFNNNKKFSNDLNELQKDVILCKCLCKIECVNREHKNFALVLGAGVSLGSGGLSWNKMIEKLKEPVVNIGINFSNIDSYIGNYQLTTAELCKIGYNNIDDYYLEIYNSIYPHKTSESRKAPLRNETLDAVADCIKRNKLNLKVLTYNYDNYLEKALDTKSFKNYYIQYDNNNIDDNHKVAIYHVHGYLPDNYTKLDTKEKQSYQNSIVLTEDEYNSLYDDAYSWRIEKQLELFRSRTCIFVGHSMRDHNVKRLLEIAHSTKHTLNSNASCIHYAIMKDNENKMDSAEKINYTFSLAEKAYIQNYFMLFNVRILWISDFREIKRIIDMI